MKLIQPSAIALIACTFATQAQPGQASSDPSRVIHDVAFRTGLVRTAADSLAASDHDPRTSIEVRSRRLAEITDQMNAIDRDLRFLDAHRTTLAVWEVQAIGESAPWLVETARNTNAAIEELKADSTHINLAPDYAADVERIFADSTKAQRVLHDHFALQAARQQEHRASRDLGY